MPKGIKGFQKGHGGFVSEEAYKIIGEKTRARMRKICAGGKIPPWLKGKSPFVRGHTLQVGEKHWAWKGGGAGKTALHDWVKRRLGVPRRCEHCGTTKAHKF